MHRSVDDKGDEEMIPMCSSGGKKGNSRCGSPPSFLKKMTESTMASVLVTLVSHVGHEEMPTSFGECIATRIGNSVTLEGPSKEKWSVEVGVSLQNRNVELRDGWRKFVEAHVLQIGDQLSFTLTADSFLQVLVYDESGSQKASTINATKSPITPRQSKPNGIHIAVVDNETRKRPVSRPKQTVRRTLIKTPAANSPVKPEVPGGTSSQPDWRGNDPPRDERGLLPLQKVVGGQVVSQRRPITDGEKLVALQAARAQTFPHDSFLVIMCKGYVTRGFSLTPKKEASRKYLPLESRDVILMNKAGHQWAVKWMTNPTKSGFSGGWRAFVLDNRLEEFDVCVFEVLGGEKFVILVHIFRVIGGPGEDIGDYRPRLRSCERKKRKAQDKNDLRMGGPREQSGAEATVKDVGNSKSILQNGVET